MGIQERISEARAVLVRQYEKKCGEHFDLQEEENILSDEIIALVIDLDLALA